LSITNTNNNLLLRNTISEVFGGAGGNATSQADGGEGGMSYGVYLQESDNNEILSNILSGVIGGKGGYDSSSRHDGDGGSAYGLYFSTVSNNTIIDNLIENITGYDGGSCTSFGGRGGNSIGVDTYGASDKQYANKNNSFISNRIINITGGRGGDSGGFGAEAGHGGSAYGFSWVTINGTIISDFVICNIHGGDGGTGGTGGAGGTGGNGGNAVGMEIWRDFGYNTTITNTSISDVIKGNKGLGQDGAPNGVDGTAEGLRNTGYVVTFINGSIENSSNHDLYLVSGKMEIINSSFNKSRTFVQSSNSKIYVKWFVHITVLDLDFLPVPDANIRIQDNDNGSFDENFTTGIDGSRRWILCTEFYQDSSDRVFLTPHNITATNDFYKGFAQPEPIIDRFREIVIILSIQRPFLNLSQGWNFISVPNIQPDPDPGIVLQEIEGEYDAIQWYDSSGFSDFWKHNHTKKPSHLNDFDHIDHYKGFWIHITAQDWILFPYPGTQPASNQSITLNPGWNMVGYPSLTSYNRTKGMNNIIYGNDVDAIWSFNATDKMWETMDESDFFILGKGYWVHSKVTKVWDVPL
jgi:hypothetical protein